MKLLKDSAAARRRERESGEKSAEQKRNSEIYISLVMGIDVYKHTMDRASRTMFCCPEEMKC